MSDPGVGGERAASAGSRERVRAIDGLRTLAVAAVVAYHLGYLPGGWVGVDLFFVLSGYLITSLLLGARRAGTGLDLRGFWGRRARRLLPAALTCIAVVVAIGTVLEPEAVGAWARTGGASALWVGNWQQILAGGSYFDGFGAPNALKHLWSLSVEEQAYLVWPPVIAAIAWLLRKRTDRVVATAVAIVASLGAAASAAAGIAMAPGVGEDTTRVWFGTDTRALAPLLGAALAATVAARGWPTSRVGRGAATAVGAVGLFALGAVVVALDDQHPAIWRGGSVLVALASAAAVAAAARPGPIQDALGASRAMTWSGRALSYALYLWHWPVIVLLTPTRTGLDGLPLDGVRVAVAVALSALSWHLVEHPLRAGAPIPRPRTGRPAVALTLGAVVVVAAVGFGVGASHPTRSERMGALLASSDEQPVLAASVGPVDQPELDRSTTAPTTPPPPKASVYGDSVAWSFSVGITPELVAAHGLSSFTNHAEWGCQLLVAPRRSGGRTDPADTACADWPERWGASVTAERPDLVILSVGAWEVFDRQLDGVWREPGSPAHDAHLSAAFDQALELLGAHGARLAVTTAPVPDRPDDGLSAAEWVPSDATRARVSHLNELIRAAAARHGATVVEMDQLWCPDPGGPCREEPRRYDGIHFDPDTAAGPVLGFVLEQARSPELVSAGT